MESVCWFSHLVSTSKLRSSEQFQWSEDAPLWTLKQQNPEVSWEPTTSLRCFARAARTPWTPWRQEVMTDGRLNSHVSLPKCCFSHLPFQWKWRRKESQPTRLISRQFISKQSVTQENAVGKKEREKKSGRVCLSARNSFHTIYIIASLTCMDDYFWLSILVILIFPELFITKNDLQCLKAIGISNH